MSRSPSGSGCRCRRSVAGTTSRGHQHGATAKRSSEKTFSVWNETASSIPQPTQQALRTLEWVDRHENLCVCGPSGTGKSHFCEALGQAAIDSGRSVAWFAIDELGALVRRHRADDSITKAIARLTRVDLVIVDDIGMLPVGADAPPKASTASSTPPMNTARWPSRATCTPPGSTSSCPRPWPPPPSTGCCITPTSA